MCTTKISLDRTAKQKVKRQEQQKTTGAQSNNRDTNMGSGNKNWHYGASSPSLLIDLHTTLHCWGSISDILTDLRTTLHPTYKGGQGSSPASFTNPGI